MSDRNRMRLPLLACAVLVSLFTACSDATGPRSDARAGYITNSGAISASAATAPSSTGVKTDSIAKKLPMRSGYNVPAF